MTQSYIVCDDYVYKFFIEYMNTFEGFIPITKSDLSRIDFNLPTELYVIQKGSWLPDSVFRPSIKLSLVNTEQLCDSSVEERVFEEIRILEKRYENRITVHDYSEINCKILEKGGFMVSYHPYIAPSKEIETLKALNTENKVYDIGFVGALNTRRSNILNLLREKGISVLYVDSFGIERDRDLARCKYILNIHWESHFTIFESIRCNRWLQAGYSVITELSRDTYNNPFLFSFPYEKLVLSIYSILRTESEVYSLEKYIHSCIKPISTGELCSTRTFTSEQYSNLVQDGILFSYSPIQSIPKANGIDYIQINHMTIFRKNSPLQLHWLKSNGSIVFDVDRTPVYRRFIPPPIETIDHVFIISKILSATQSAEKTYVEYGVRSGTSIEAISKLVKEAHGVDISAYTPQNSNIQFHKMLTDAFSESYLQDLVFHYAFIDADHSSKQVLIDFEYIYKYIQKGGYIFLHDTYPCDPLFLREDYCNDCYLTPIRIREKYPEIQMITFPINPGLTIIHKQ